MLLHGNKNKKTRVVVGMSGGVDSSVAAALLIKAGFEVIGVTFKTWPKEECGLSYGRTCCSLEAITRARTVAEDLGIAYYVVDFHSEFKKNVIDYFCSEYLKGYTPNPCIMCNEKIKFGVLLDKAKSLGASFVATGHFARASFDKRSGRYVLKQGKDLRRDQSYFLFSLTQGQLKAAIFPLGGLTKEDVRARARRARLKTHNTASSQDICFVHDMGYAEYIRKKTGVCVEKGEIAHKDGRVLGRHNGIVNYTIGQRRGLGIPFKDPLYVIAIDPINNRIIVGAKRDVLRCGLIADRVNWVALPGISGRQRCLVKIRYNHPKAKAHVSNAGGGSIRVEFDEPQEAPTPGQAVVCYDKERVLCGGWITATF